jgi:hypothetical protein
MPKDDPRHDQAALFGDTGKAGAGWMTIIAEIQKAIDRSGCWFGEALCLKEAGSEPGPSDGRVDGSVPANRDADQRVRPRDRLICMAVSDLPVAHVPSYLDQCGVCGRAVWRSDRSGWFGALPICTRCASEAIRACQARGEGSVVRAAPYVGEDMTEGQEGA